MTKVTRVTMDGPGPSVGLNLRDVKVSVLYGSLFMLFFFDNDLGVFKLLSYQKLRYTRFCKRYVDSVSVTPFHSLGHSPLSKKSFACRDDRGT